jgi:hypothetical protein
LVITKILFGAAIAFAAAAGVASPAGADPSPFGTLGCSCSAPATAPDAKAPVTDQMHQGLKNGLGYLKLAPSPANNS